ncbi:MAG TPA: hypothetical protein VKY65_17975 [Alphaproteobacteria bacterium]|nr:hypothetical protein [Alphaproteobacteria bacterium]
MQLFLPITKVDAAKRLVYGTLAEEVPDRAGEIFDYASSKPNFARWSAEIAKASDGRSLGNLRAMHGKVAAGKLAALEFDDDGRRIEAVAKVVDAAEWAKVLEGVYTGFSIGGKYVRRWKDEADPALTRYTADPAEVSLVDNPCIPTATFTMIKLDGSEERRFFKGGAASAREDDEALAKAGARHSKVDKARLQKAHDLLVALGADCNGAAADDAEAAAADGADRDGEEKAAAGVLAKLAAANAALETALADLAPALAALQKRVDALEAQPLPPKGALKAIDKKEDGASGLGKGEASPDPTDALALVKRAHRHPLPIFAAGAKP